MKILTVIGARPQFIKSAPVSRSFRGTQQINEVIVHTGQHYDPEMNHVFFADLELPPPAYNLDVRSGSHGEQTGRMLERLEKVIERESPDWVLVYGDTNSTLAGALAAAKLNLKVAHVEAGLRSFDRRMPEEVNRVLTDHASDLLFAPTASAVHNLKAEGITRRSVELVGDVMYDAVLQHTDRALRISKVLDRHSVQARRYVLATIHRAGNTDDRASLRAVFEGLLDVAKVVPIVLPLHPRTRKSLDAEGMLGAVEHALTVIDPVGYLDMLMLEHHACLIITDSGGVQKEAFFHRVPCVTLRRETEWVELVTSGWNRLVPPLGGDLASHILSALSENHPKQQPESIFGDGKAARTIADRLLEFGD